MGSGIATNKRRASSSYFSTDLPVFLRVLANSQSKKRLKILNRLSFFSTHGKKSRIKGIGIILPITDTTNIWSQPSGYGKPARTKSPPCAAHNNMVPLSSMRGIMAITITTIQDGSQTRKSMILSTKAMKSGMNLL